MSKLVQFNGYRLPSTSLLVAGCPLWSVIATIVVLPFLLTYILSSIRFMRMRRAKHGSRHPPLIPYWIPFVGHTIPFVFNTPGFMTSLV